MHAIIPAAGRGTRLRPLTHTVPKPLIHVAGKPMLGHIIDDLAAAGVDRLTLVVGHLGEELASWTRETYPGMRTEIAVQERTDGLGSAVGLAAPHTRSEPTLVVLSDTLFRADLRPVLESGRNMLAVHRVEEPERFGIVQMEGDRVERLVEKPSEFVGDLAIVGVYAFADGRELMEAIGELVERDIRTRGEYQLTDAMQMMLDGGREFGTFEVDEWFDCGKLSTLLQTNRDLLELDPPPPAEIEGSAVIGPVSIAPDAVVEASVVGPHVTVCSGARIRGSVVRDSILEPRCTVEGAVLQGSLVGPGATVRGRPSGVSAGSDCLVEP